MRLWRLILSSLRVCFFLSVSIYLGPGGWVGTHALLLSNKSQLGWNTKLYSFISIWIMPNKETTNLPILITNTIRNNQIRQILQHRHGSSVHKIQCAAIIRFLEFVFIWQSARIHQYLGVGSGLGFLGVRTCGILVHLCGRLSMSRGEDCRVVRIVWRIRICLSCEFCVCIVLWYFDVLWVGHCDVVSILYVLGLPLTKIFARSVE